MSTADAVSTGIWSPFRSLLGAQVLSAVLGLVFWVLVARLVDAHEVGVAAAAISAQTLLGIVTVLGHSTTLVSELSKHESSGLIVGLARSRPVDWPDDDRHLFLEVDITREASLQASGLRLQASGREKRNGRVPSPERALFSC